MKMENESAKEVVTPGALFYIITKKSRFDTAFLDLQWLFKARSRDITRPAITGILVEPAKIVATDGHRLHLITNPYPSISCGEYDVYAINQSKVILIAKPDGSDDRLFPNWNRPVITMEGNTPEHEIAITNPTYFYTEILKHHPVNIKLLQDAISNELMNVRIYGENQPVIIATKTRTAIVMPLLVKK
jgi:hypothetical protein